MSVFCAPKAGMAKVDTAHVNSVVYAMSKDSLHFRHQQQLADNTSRRIQQLQRRIQTLRSEPPSYLAHLNQRASDLLASLENQRDLSHMWLHVDLDSFYASVELRDRPDLRDKPVAVGGPSMICTSNYIARRYGVRSAMPGFVALKLCPQLHFIPTNFPKYKAVAAVFRAIFAQYDPSFESASLDEAYLDITAHLAAKQAQQPTDQPWDRDAEATVVAAEIRQRVFDATQLTCSAGIACNRMLAKIATDVNKPNGQHLVPSNLPAILAFITPLPVRQVPGIGKVLERTLNALGIQTVGQLRSDEYRPLLVDCFSELTHGWLFRVGLGLGRVEHEDEDARRRKSVSTESTFRDISSYVELTSKVDEIARSLHGDVERLGVKGRTLTLKLKTSAFEVKQHSVSVDKGLWIHKLEDLRRLGLQLLKEELNRLLAGKKLKRAAEEKLEKTSQAIGRSTGGTTNSRVAVGSPFDGLLRIRLMGLRLSALYVDETGEADNESAADGGEQGAGGTAKRRGGMSILKFAKRLDDAEQEAIVDEERAEEQQSSKRRKAELDDTDISKYFDVVSPTKGRTPLSSADSLEAAGMRREKGSRRNIESYFSQSAAAMATDGTKDVVDVDDVVEDIDCEADEWMDLLQDAAAASAGHQSGADEPMRPVSPAADVTVEQLSTAHLSVSTTLPSALSPTPQRSPSPLAATPAAFSPPPSTAFSTTTPSPTSLPNTALSMQCPVCARELCGSDGRPVSNLALNQHIDACLRNDSQATIESSQKTLPHKALSSTRKVAAAPSVAPSGAKGSGGRQRKRMADGGRPVSLVDMWKSKQS